jgi:hypothetical protein
MSCRWPATVRAASRVTARCFALGTGLAGLLFAGACSVPPPAGAPSEDEDNLPTIAPGVWNPAFDASGVGALSVTWGTGPDNVFMAGGRAAQGEIYHFDGSAWRAMVVPEVPFLVWMHGFAPDNVIAVGMGGGAVHYDGQKWSRLESGTTEDLWGVWGHAPNDMWMVGGDVADGPPVAIHFDGSSFVPADPLTNDRSATVLFKIWGMHDKVVAVGENGLIVELQGGRWTQMETAPGADDDLISLWGTRPDHIVAAGGRTAGLIVVYDGQAWSKVPLSDVPGLSTVHMPSDDLALVGGDGAFVGVLNMQTREFFAEETGADLLLHSIWSDGTGRIYATGGQFRDPFIGLALMRTADDPGITPLPPLPPEDAPPACGPDEVLRGGVCEPLAVCLGPDSDGDSVPDDCDNCPELANPDQKDKDRDGAGSACDRCQGFDDGLDADADGVPDGCDVCGGSNDAADADGDGIPDGCDNCGAAGGQDADADGVADACDRCPGFDDTSDADGDGVPNGCDRCAGSNDAADADDDGVADGCDACPGGNDSQDSDGDGVPNACDNCGGADSQDADGDGVPDACDVCQGFNDAANADGDARPDGCDNCPGHNDSADADGDGVADGCDDCPGHPDSADADADGVPDGCDVCAGGSDSADADGDGVPDHCDVCPGHDDAADADADDVPDGCDVCPGHDDAIDEDHNGVPDGCCAQETDCVLGENCTDGACQPSAAPDLEIGQGGGTGCLPDEYRQVRFDGQLQICEGFQGLIDLYLTLRATGFAPNAHVQVTRRLSLLDAPCAAQEQCGDGYFCLDGLCSPSGEFTVNRQMADIGGGVNELPTFHFILFDAVNNVDGRPAVLRVVLQEHDSAEPPAELEIEVLLFGSRLCSNSSQCPQPQVCVDGYCHE